MKTRDLPNFRLQFTRIQKFLKEAEPTDPKHKRDLKIAKEAYNTVVSVMYLGARRCNGVPVIPLI